MLVTAKLNLTMSRFEPKKFEKLWLTHNPGIDTKPTELLWMWTIIKEGQVTSYIFTPKLQKDRLWKDKLKLRVFQPTLLDVTGLRYLYWNDPPDYEKTSYISPSSTTPPDYGRTSYISHPANNPPPWLWKNKLHFLSSYHTHMIMER